MKRIPSLQRMGVQTIWLTPVTEQFPMVSTEAGEKLAPYHGYCSADLRRVDAHLGGWDDWRRLVEAVHAAGMQLLVDLPSLLPDPHSPGQGPRWWDDGRVWAAYEEGQWRLPSGQAFDEESVVWRQHLASVAQDWLARGADGVRFAHARQLPLWFWQELSGSLQKISSGFRLADWQLGHGGDPRAAEFHNRSGFSMLDYGWRNAVVSALAHRSDEGFRALAQVIERDVSVHNPSHWVCFVNHHDFPRFLSLCGDESMFRLALGLTLMARGIPMLFYGDECNLHNNQQRGHDPYNRPWLADQEAVHAEWIGGLSQIRCTNSAVQFGGMRTKWLDHDRWAFTRSWLGSHVLIAVNRSAQPAELALMGLELPDGAYGEVQGGETLEVLDGAGRVRVPAAGMVVYAVAAPLPDFWTEVRIHGVSTQFGERVRLVTQEERHEMEYVHAASWGTSATFPLGAAVAYGYEVIRGDQVLRSTGLRFQRRVDGQPWMDEW